MKKKYLITSFLFLFIGMMNAREVKDITIKITHGPYLCDMDQHGVTIVWTTSRPALSWVEAREYSPASFYETPHARHYDVLNGRRQAHKTLHVVRLKDLKPGQKYQYRVYSKEVLEWNGSDNLIYGRTVATDVYRKAPLTFTTLKEQTDKISFAIFNDIHGRADLMKKLCARMDTKALDFVMFNGDMANSIESEEQIFSNFIDTAVEEFASEVPIMYCRGNHETRGGYADFLIKYYPMREDRFYHYIKIGNTAFLILDCGEDKPDNDIEYAGIAVFDDYRIEQAKWLSNVIENHEFKSAEKRIVFLHIPPMANSWHGAAHLMRHLIPLLNKANIDVMFSGHTHRYSFHPADSKVNFPTVVNSNNTFVRCDVTSGGIEIKIVGEDGKVEHKHSF